MGTVASANPFATSRKHPSAGEGLSWLHTIPYPTSGVGSSTGRNTTPRSTALETLRQHGDPEPFSVRDALELAGILDLGDGQRQRVPGAVEEQPVDVVDHLRVDVVRPIEERFLQELPSWHSLQPGPSMPSSQIEFVDAADRYTSPGAALDRYRVLVKERLDAGAVWIRIVGELPLVGRTRAEIAAWTGYESIVNLAFASAPATIMCTSDTEALPRGVAADVHRAHPSIADGSLGSANPSYRDAEELLPRPAGAR